MRPVLCDILFLFSLNTVFYLTLFSACYQQASFRPQTAASFRWDIRRRQMVLASGASGLKPAPSELTGLHSKTFSFTFKFSYLLFCQYPSLISSRSRLCCVASMCLLTWVCAPTGHEDATEDFGIYEFVSIPGKMESAQVERRPCLCTQPDLHALLLKLLAQSCVWIFPCLPPQASCRSLARLESAQDMHTTIYDVIRHVPEMPCHSLLK